MTARKAGVLAAEGVFVTLRRLRDQWVLLVFAASVLFWARDVYDRFVDLPARVEALGEAIGELRSGVARLEAGQARPTVDRSPALVFPGARHAIGDVRPGDVITVSLGPVERVRGDCRSSELVAFMIDADGKWYSVETELVRVPHIEGFQKLAFGVKVHPRMAVGRAQLLVQMTHDCGSHRQVDDSPRLPFRVLPARGRPAGGEPAR